MTEQQYLDIVAGWESEPKTKPTKTVPSKELHGVQIGVYIYSNRSIYVQFLKQGAFRLMPTAIVRKWRPASRYRHSFRSVDRIVTENDLIRKVLIKMSNNL
jgi:hypothetical protein